MERNAWMLRQPGSWRVGASTSRSASAAAPSCPGRAWNRAKMTSSIGVPPCSLPIRRPRLDEPPAPRGNRDPLEAGPPEPGEAASVDAARVQALAPRQVHLPALRPVAEDHGLRSPPRVEPRPPTHGPDLGQLLARAFLGALAGRDARVDQDEAVFSHEQRPIFEPAQPARERGAELRTYRVERRRAPALEQRDLVIAEDGHGLEPAGQREDARAVGAAVHEISAQREAVPGLVEARRLQEILQLERAALDVAHEEGVHAAGGATLRWPTAWRTRGPPPAGRTEARPARRRGHAPARPDRRAPAVGRSPAPAAGPEGPPARGRPRRGRPGSTSRTGSPPRSPAAGAPLPAASRSRRPRRRS